MEIFILDQEGTNEDMVFNNQTEEEIAKSCEHRSEVLNHVDLGVESTMININGSYVTSRSNAADYTEMYGWHFSKSIIIEM